MADPESAIIALINGNDGWVTDTNLFRGPVYPDENVGSPIPREAVFVQLTGGPPPLDYSDGSISPQEYEYNVQVIVRGAPDTYGSTRTKAQTIWVLIHDTDPAPYIAVRATTASPVPVGQDERRSFIFVINARLLIVE